MENNTFERGMVLIFVLSLMLIFSLISIHLIQSTLIMWQTSYHLEDQFDRDEEAEQELSLAAKKLIEKIKEDGIFPEDATFIPDHLDFGLTEGVIIVPIKIPKNNIVNYFALRLE